MTQIFKVLEETGYNLARQIRVNDVIELSVREQTVALYIVPGVPEDFPFKTRTRKEISVSYRAVFNETYQRITENRVV